MVLEGRSCGLLEALPHISSEEIREIMKTFSQHSSRTRVWIITVKPARSVQLRLTLILSRFMFVTTDGVWISELDLLITCTHHSELQVITALSLISTFYKSQQHLLSLFQHDAFISSCLATASNSGDSSAFPAHVVTVPRISRN
jgi:hypothetical protein